MARILTKPSRTFGEYTLRPRLNLAGQTPDKVSLVTPLTRYKRGEEPQYMLNIPFTSAAMQSVSGVDMGIALSRRGGLSFTFCSQPVESEADMVRRIKNHKAGFVDSKANLPPDATLEDAIKLTDTTGYSTIPITVDGKNGSQFVGILTDRDYWRNDPLTTRVSELMTRFDPDRFDFGREGITLEDANDILRKSRRSCIPILGPDNTLVSLVFKRDRDTHEKYPLEMVDTKKRLIAAAAINTKDYETRVPALIAAGVNVLCIDTSDGYSEHVKNTIGWVKKHFPGIPVGAGNVVDAEAFMYLVKAGADFVKVGIGGGAICITQEVKGIGRGQATAVEDCVKARDRLYKETGLYVPLCSDGGLVQDSHITISFGFGADFVMMGRYFARCDESPTERKIQKSMGLAKPYWGEGTNRAKNWQRYSMGGKLSFEEGVDGWVPYAGKVDDVLDATLAVITATMAGNIGAMDLALLRRRAVLQPRSEASIREGKPHDIIMSDPLGTYANMHWG